MEHSDRHDDDLMRLARMVRAMRGLQVEYFRTRKPTVLERAKSMEIAVDRLVEKILSPQLELLEQDAES